MAILKINNKVAKVNSKAIYTTQTSWYAYVWGSSAQYQCGFGDTTAVQKPTRINNNLYKDACGCYQSTLLLKNDGTLWFVGASANYENSVNTSTRTTLTQIGSDNTWTKINCGASTYYAIKANGTLWAWGSNAAGQTGTGGNTMAQVGVATNWSRVVGGSQCVVGLTTDGKLWYWGNPAYTYAQKNSPFQIGTDVDWAWVGGGYYGLAAIKTNGNLYTHGDYFGTAYNGITKIGTDTDWSFGDNGIWTCYLPVKTNGKMYMLGSNANGALGMGNNSNTYATPTLNPTLSGMTTTSVAGCQQCSFVVANGKLYTSGGGGVDGTYRNGQINGNIYTFTQIGGDTDWVAVKRTGTGAHGIAFKKT